MTFLPSNYNPIWPRLFSNRHTVKVISIIFFLGLSSISIIIARNKFIYKSSFIGYYTILFWILLIFLFLVFGYFVIIEDIRLVIISGLFLCITILFLPSITVGTYIYGFDGYLKAAVAKNLIQSGNIQGVLYPGSSVFIAVTQLLSGLHIVLGTKLAIAISAVFTGLLAHHRTQSRFPLLLIPTLPLGLGQWLSTVSTFHNFYLFLPLAIIASEVNTRMIDNPKRWGIISLTINISLSLLHPLLLLIVSSWTILEIFSTCGFHEQRPKLRVILTILFPISVVALWFQLFPTIQGLLGLFVSPALNITVTSSKCINSQSVVPCSSLLANIGQRSYILTNISVIGLSFLAVCWYTIKQRTITPNIAKAGTGLLIFGGLCGLWIGTAIPMQIVDRLLAVFGVFCVIATGAAARSRVPKRVISQILIIFVLISALFIPLLYPNPSLNKTPNGGVTISEEEQIKWVDSYRENDGLIATRKGAWKVHRYYQATQLSNQYTGSSWLMGKFIIPDSAIHVRSYQNIAGEPVSESRMRYVAITSLTADFVFARYVNNSTLITKHGVVTSTTVTRQVDHPDLIYSSSDNTKVYYINNGSGSL